MLDELRKIDVRRLLEEAEWTCLDIDYHPPRVERMWTSIGNGMRLNLHRIHPCKASDALWHPHPWPSAMQIITGHYEMGIAYFPTHDHMVTLGKVELGPGDRYSMDTPFSGHYVAPLDDTPSLSLMLTGKPWETSHRHLGKGQAKTLSKADTESLREAFETHFRIRLP
jgi:hypothetical protein